VSEPDSIARVALFVALVLIAAKAGAEAATRLKQPPVLGELLAGVLLGNLPWSVTRSLGTDTYVDMLAQLGAIILLFEVGLESTVREVISIGGSVLRVAVLGTVGSFAAGWVAARLAVPHEGVRVQVLLAASICATSVGISARVLKDLGQSRTKEARTILGASVVDDVLALLVLAVVGGWIRGRESASIGALAWLVAKTLGALVISVAIGVRVTPRIFAVAARLRTPGVLLAVGLAFCFFMSWGADKMGVAPIIGAFAAGLVLEDSHSALFVRRGERSLGELIEPIAEMLVPIFFVVMGIRADVRSLLEPSTIALAIAMAVAAIAGKTLCGIGASRGVNRATIAAGMLPRGEVTLVFGALGSAMLVFDRRHYSALVAVVLLTTLLTPPLLERSIAKKISASEA
jgi:Kef-type K+ transport system membrane component KefB